jgi:hypothetical protein
MSMDVFSDVTDSPLVPRLVSGSFTEMQADMFAARNHHAGWQPNCLVIASSEERESRCLKSPK